LGEAGRLEFDRIEYETIMDITILDYFEAKLKLHCGWDMEDESHGHKFATGPLVTEADLQRIEAENSIRLPHEYREFLKRFGDGDVGPGNLFIPLSRGLSINAKQSFPLSQLLLGECSPELARLPPEKRWEVLGPLVSQWETIPKDFGTLRICEYGCNISAVLILNGPYSGKIWILCIDTAYFGPFGGSECLHNEFANWTATHTPKEYSFLEWYLHWLESKVEDLDYEQD
jgi:SMI1 / KNR4 family (SUKH-1)